MSGCAHARMGSLGPHPSPECEDARPSLPALRSGWAILILRGRDHGLITTPNHTTTSWRVNRAILHILFTPRGPRARGCVKRETASDKAFIVCLVSLLTRKPKLFRDLVVRSFCVSRFTVLTRKPPNSLITHLSESDARSRLVPAFRRVARSAVLVHPGPGRWRVQHVRFSIG